MIENNDLLTTLASVSDNIRKTSVLAKLSLILGIIGLIGAPPVIFLMKAGVLPSLEIAHIPVYAFIILLCPILCFASLILGIIAMWRIKKIAFALKGKGMALSGLIVGGFSTLLWGGLIVFAAVMIIPAFSRQSEIEQFDPVHYKGPMGTITIPYQGNSFLYVIDTATNKQMSLAGNKGVISAPAGTFELLAYQAICPDEHNYPSIACSLWKSRTTITVENNSTQQLEVGPPFTASIVIKSSNQDTITMDCNLRDRGGNPARLPGQDEGFLAASQSGGILWQDKFPRG